MAMAMAWTWPWHGHGQGHGHGHGHGHGDDGHGQGHVVIERMVGPMGFLAAPGSNFSIQEDGTSSSAH